MEAEEQEKVAKNKRMAVFSKVRHFQNILEEFKAGVTPVMRPVSPERDQDAGLESKDSFQGGWERGGASPRQGEGEANLPPGVSGSQSYSHFSSSQYYPQGEGGNFSPSPPWSGGSSWGSQGSYNRPWEDNRFSRQEAQIQDLANAVQGMMHALHHHGMPVGHLPPPTQENSPVGPLYEEEEWAAEEEDMQLDGQDRREAGATPKKKAKTHKDGSPHEVPTAGSGVAQDTLKQEKEAGGA